MCEGHCFKDTDSAAQYLAQSVKQGWDSGDVPIVSVKCEYDGQDLTYKGKKN